MPTDPSHQAPSRSGYADLAREIRDAGLLRPRPGYYLILGGVLLGGLTAIVATMIVWSDSWWLICLAPAYAVLSTQIAYFSHDAAHRQVIRGRRGTELLCLLFGDTLNGLGYGWWTAKHNAHHAHPNDLARDPDVAGGAFVFDPDQAGARRGFTRWWTRHQAGLFFPALTLEGFSLRVSSARAVADPRTKYRLTEAVLLLTHAVLYAALLITTLTAAQAVVFLLVHQCLFGIYLGCSFAPSHKGMPEPSPEEAADPLLRQVLASRNISGGPAMDLALGGLNLQIEHHLFPSMPRPHLRRAHPIVWDYCRRHGIRCEESSLLGAYGSALQHLHVVGAGPRAKVPATAGPQAE